MTTCSKITFSKYSPILTFNLYQKISPYYYPLITKLPTYGNIYLHAYHSTNTLWYHSTEIKNFTSLLRKSPLW